MNEKLPLALSPEEKIKEAARRVFIAKGFDGCSSREIAKEAGMNVALVNYYFRSKSKLFQLIFQAAMEDFLLSMVDVFESDLPLESRVRILIEREYDFLTKNPEIPMFIIAEITRKDGCSIDKMGIHERIKETGIYEECIRAQEEGKMRKIDMVSIMMIMKSNCQFPFMSRPLVKGIHNLTDEQFDQQLVLHKQYVTEMIVGYLFPNQSK